jgi:hypothetical protein
MILCASVVHPILDKMFESYTLLQYEDAMVHTIWFGLTSLLLVLMTLMVCVTILYFVLRQNKSDKATSEQVIQLLAKMSEQQVYITDRHEVMTSILATVSNEFLRLRQKKDAV